MLSNKPFDFGRLSLDDEDLAIKIIGSSQRVPDLVIAPDGYGEYLFRWHVIPRNEHANVYFHIQTESDPERPLHDHPWDNTSVILAGGYDEILDIRPQDGHPTLSRRVKGDVIHRQAHWAHRLLRPDNIPYTMSLFATGPKFRDWGFWTPNGTWIKHSEVTDTNDGISQWKDYQNERLRES